MKKVFSALLALLLFACNTKEEQPADKNLHISGTVKGLKKGKLYIQKIEDTVFVTVDSIIIDGNPDFDSYINVESPEMYYLVLDRGETKSMDDKLPFFAEPGTMTINTKLDGFYAKAKITGSENHKLYEDYLKMKSRFTDQNLDLIKLSTEAAKNNNIKKIDSIESAQVNLLKKRYLYTANFALNHATHEIGPYLALAEIPDVGIKYLDTINKRMTPKVEKSHYGKLLKSYVEQRRENAE